MIEWNTFKMAQGASPYSCRPCVAKQHLLLPQHSPNLLNRAHSFVFSCSGQSLSLSPSTYWWSRYGGSHVCTHGWISTRWISTHRLWNPAAQCWLRNTYTIYVHTYYIYIYIYIINMYSCIHTYVRTWKHACITFRIFTADIHREFTCIIIHSHEVLCL